jgi:hypothetical protein
MTKAAVESLPGALPSTALVGGSDWNQNLVAGREYQGSEPARRCLAAALESLNLQVPTAALPHGRGNGCHTIDHIAVPSTWQVEPAVQVVAEVAVERFSDHDAYAVQVLAN